MDKDACYLTRRCLSHNLLQFSAWSLELCQMWCIFLVSKIINCNLTEEKICLGEVVSWVGWQADVVGCTQPGLFMMMFCVPLLFKTQSSIRLTSSQTYINCEDDTHLRSAPQHWTTCILDLSNSWSDGIADWRRLRVLTDATSLMLWISCWRVLKSWSGALED